MNGSECFEFERILHAKFEAFAQTNSEWFFPLYGTKFPSNSHVRMTSNFEDFDARRGVCDSISIK